MLRFLLLALVLAAPSRALSQAAPGSALFEAAGRGDVPAVSALLDGGADVNAEDSHSGRTPLIWATRNLQAGLVKTLLDKGADRALTDKDGRTALAQASEFSPETVKLLIERKSWRCCKRPEPKNNTAA